MKLKCVSSGRDSFTAGEKYDVIEVEPCGNYKIESNFGTQMTVFGESLKLQLNPSVQFELTEEPCDLYCDKPMTPQSTMESLKIATLRRIQEQCSKANLSISIDPEGFNIFDCDTDMQTMVHSVAETIEILETKIEYKDSMGKWGWV